MMLRALFDEKRRREIQDALKLGKPIKLKGKMPMPDALPTDEETIYTPFKGGFSFYSDRFRKNAGRLAKMRDAAFNKTDVNDVLRPPCPEKERDKLIYRKDGHGNEDGGGKSQ